MIFAWMSPVTAVPIPATTTTHSPMSSDGRITSRSLLRSSRNALTATRKIPAVRNEAASVCGNVISTVEFVMTAQIEVSSARPRSALMV